LALSAYLSEWGIIGFD